MGILNKEDVPVSTVTRNAMDIADKTGNLYEAIAIISKRADQVGTVLKNELNSKLEEFASHTDTLEEIFENREQIEISKFYERLPKPTAVAVSEFMGDEVYYRDPANDND